MMMTIQCAGKTHGHNFIGQVCINGCGMTQQDVNSLFRGDRKAPEQAYNPLKIERRGKGMHSKAHYIAREIAEEMGEIKQYKRYLGAVTRAGTEVATQIASEIRQSRGVKNKPALFFWKIKPYLRNGKKQNEDKGKNS